MENSTCMHPHIEREGDRDRKTERDREGQTETGERGEVHPGEVQKSILVQLSEYGFIKVTITFSFSFHS